MAKKRKPESVPSVEPDVQVVKNETLKDGPMEEHRSLIKADIKDTPLGKSIALFCDHCYARDRCPEFKPGQECVFQKGGPKVETGTEIRQAILNLLAVQIQRINQARNIENLDGGYPDGSLSAEMDRFLEMVRTLRDISDTRDSLTVQARGPGIITRIFGEMIKKQPGAS